jgi:hypothetical protein
VATLDSGDAARRAARDLAAARAGHSWLDWDSGLPSWPGGPGPGWPLSVRVRVRVRRFSLDRQLARGADPCSLELARRAEELCRPKLRCALGADIERAVDAASVPPPRWLTAAIPLSRQSIKACRSLLLEVAEELRCSGPLYARGVALVRLLLVDGRSPLYAPSEPPRLEEEVRRARAALFLG